MINQKKVSYKVQANDNISIDIPEAKKETKLKAQEIPLDIIYEDSDIIVINKPKGMVVHPANGNPDGTLVNAIFIDMQKQFVWYWWRIKTWYCT